MRFSKLNVVMTVTATCLLATQVAQAQDEPAAGDAPAAAEPAAPPAGAAAPAEAAPAAAPAAADAGEAKGVHEHDGFFFRVALGPGYFIGKSKPDEGGGDADVKGI